MRDMVVAAYIEDEREHNRRLAEKKRERVMANWRRLIKTVLIREQLNLKYETFQGGGGGTKPPVPVKHNSRAQVKPQQKIERVKFEEDGDDEDFDEEKRNLVGGKLNSKLSKNEEAAAREQHEGVRVKASDSNTELLKLTKKSAIVAKKKKPEQAKNGRAARKGKKKQPESESGGESEEEEQLHSSDPEYDFKIVIRSRRTSGVKQKQQKPPLEISESSNETEPRAAASTSNSAVVTAKKRDCNGDVNLSEESDHDDNN
jgi:hypothetical protein